MKKILGIAALTLLLNNNSFAKDYITYDCIGHPSICGDTFVMKFTFEAANNNNIFISKHNLLQHRHIVEVMKHNYFKKNSKFNIKFYVINNLNKKFLFVINGKYKDNSFNIINLQIDLGDTQIAEMKLKQA